MVREQGVRVRDGDGGSGECGVGGLDNKCMGYGAWWVSGDDWVVPQVPMSAMSAPEKNGVFDASVNRIHNVEGATVWWMRCW